MALLFHGPFVPKWKKSVSSDFQIAKRVHEGKLVLMQMDFAYITTPPDGWEKEYKWVYDQDTAIKESFMTFCKPDGTKQHFPFYVEPEKIVSQVTGNEIQSRKINWSSIFIWLAALCLGAVIFNLIRTHRRKANNTNQSSAAGIEFL